MNILFDDVKLNALFQVNKYDKTLWVKASSRTARPLENLYQVFYFKKNEYVYSINNNDFYIMDNVSVDSNGYFIGDDLTLAQELHNSRIDAQIGV